MQKAIVDYNGMDEVERIIVDFDCIEHTGMFLICQSLTDDRFILINKKHVLRIELDNMNIDKYKNKYCNANWDIAVLWRGKGLDD